MMLLKHIKLLLIEITDEDYKKQLKAFKTDHERHAKELNEL